MLGRWIRAKERRHAERDTNRIVRPFEWGESFIADHGTGNRGGGPRRAFESHTREVLARSADFYALPADPDYRLEGDYLTWASSVRTPSPENNLARARFFPASPVSAGAARRAVVVLPQWNADQNSHVDLCRILNRLGITALRLTLPYHEARRPADLERADFLVCSNIGRTIQSMRQAVLDARAAVNWLAEHGGYDRIGILGTSIGSCTAFLAFVHDERIRVGVFNHVSGYFADVVWHGISTQHVRAGFGDRMTLDELRRHWLPISPMPYAERLLRLPPRPMRFIAARYDLTFPAHLSRDVIDAVRRLGLPIDVAWLPCGHYTSGQRPWVYMDAWKIISFFRKHL